MKNLWDSFFKKRELLRLNKILETDISNDKTKEIEEQKTLLKNIRYKDYKLFTKCK